MSEKIARWMTDATYWELVRNNWFPIEDVGTPIARDARCISGKRANEQAHIFRVNSDKVELSARDFRLMRFLRQRLRCRGNDSGALSVRAGTRMGQGSRRADLLMIISSLPFRRETFARVRISRSFAGRRNVEHRQTKNTRAHGSPEPDRTCWYTRKNMLPRAFLSRAAILIGSHPPRARRVSLFSFVFFFLPFFSLSSFSFLVSFLSFF